MLSRYRESRLKAVFFDIDDTLYSTSEFAQKARLNSVKAMIRVGVKMCPEELYEELTEVIQEFGPNFEHHYDKLLLRIPPEAHAGINPAVIVAAGVVAYHRTKFKGLRPFPEVPEVFRFLSRTPLIIGVITAGLEVKQAEKLIRLHLLKYIDPRAIFITGQMGIGKQNLKLYQHACQSLKLDPKECMYVGDHPVYDVDLPNTLGMVTVLVRRGGKYQELEGETEPDFVIQDMLELKRIVEEEFGVEERS